MSHPISHGFFSSRKYEIPLMVFSLFVFLGQFLDIWFWACKMATFSVDSSLHCSNWRNFWVNTTTPYKILFSFSFYSHWILFCSGLQTLGTRILHARGSGWEDRCVCIWSVFTGTFIWEETSRWFLSKLTQLGKKPSKKKLKSWIFFSMYDWWWTIKIQSLGFSFLD